jgi:hypothetical protein
MVVLMWRGRQHHGGKGFGTWGWEDGIFWLDLGALWSLEPGENERSQKSRREVAAVDEKLRNNLGLLHLYTLDGGPSGIRYGARENAPAHLHLMGEKITH